MWEKSIYQDTLSQLQVKHITLSLHLDSQLYILWLKVYSLIYSLKEASQHIYIWTQNTKGEAAYLADPSRHDVCAGGAVVCVDDNHSDDDGSNDEDHSEEHVFADERNSTGGGGDQLNNHQQEHSQREQDRDAEGHLLT